MAEVPRDAAAATTPIAAMDASVPMVAGAGEVDSPSTMAVVGRTVSPLGTAFARTVVRPDRGAVTDFAGGRGESPSRRASARCTMTVA
jgi:hypothetical protein